MLKKCLKLTEIVSFEELIPKTIQNQLKKRKNINWTANEDEDSDSDSDDSSDEDY